MVEVSETMVYATIDEQKTIDRLFRIKPASAIYYKNKTKIGYHWNLHPITIGKLKLTKE